MRSTVVLTSDEIVLTVAGAFLGLAVTLPITYLVVDRIVERREKKRLAPVSKMGKERLASKLGVGSLTTTLVTLVLDLRSAIDEGRPIPKEVSELTISKLKSFQSDLEMLLGIYNNVLSIELARLTGAVINQIEHLQEDFQFMIEIFPKPPSRSQASHVEHVILATVHLVKQDLDELGADDAQITALESWLAQFAEKHTHSAEEEPIQVSGRHVIR